MKAFTMIPMENEEFYNKDERLNLLHLYITERVRGFDKCGKPCYMSNEQFAKETNNSISTIKRAVKLLVDLKVLWAGYHQESIKNKQRILRIYNEDIGEEVQNEPLSENTEVQNDTQRGSNCTSERFKLTPTEVQNEPLVYKENIKENNYKKGETHSKELVSVEVVSEETPPTNREVEVDLGLIRRGMEKERKPKESRASGTISVDDAKAQAREWCAIHKMDYLLEDMLSAIEDNRSGLMGMLIEKNTLYRVLKEIVDDSI